MKIGVAEDLAKTSVHARYSLKAFGVTSILFLITLAIPHSMPVFIFGVICLIGMVIAGAQSIYFVVPLGVYRLPFNLQTPAQFGIAVFAALIPFFYFLGDAELSVVDVWQDNFSNWVIVGTTLIFGWFAYKARIIVGPPLVEARSFLVAVAVVAFIINASAHGALSSYDADAPSTRDEKYVDPKSSEGKRQMASNYVRLIGAAYAGLSAAILMVQRKSRAHG